MKMMRQCRAVLIPAEIEGFGLPALESYINGAPCVYVKGAAVEEVVGPGTPGGFESGDFDSFVAALDEALRMDFAHVLAKRAELLDRFKWEKTIDHMIEIYRRLTK